MKNVHKTHPKMTAERVAVLSALAKKIDREERESIKSKGRAIFAHRELMQRVIASLKAARQERGLSLTDVGEKSGIGKANLSRLENDSSPNPTWDTIVRYAESVGCKLDVLIR